MKNLRILHLSYNRLLSDAYPHLKELKSLTTLEMNHIRVANEHLQLLTNLTEVKNLDLSSTQISDDGLAHLKAFKSLEALALRANKKITNKGIPALTQLTTLKTLNVRSTKINAAGFEEIKKALPNCKVITAGEKKAPGKK